MKTTNNTILITGGSAGIGFETAKLLSEKGNKVIIVGRDSERLANAAKLLHGVTAIQADISDKESVANLVSTLKTQFPELNVLINNAGVASVLNLNDESKDALQIAEQEMLTNYFAIVNLNQQLLPVLKRQAESAIVNVSSVVSFAPALSLPTYSASKAALHSYTIALRASLQDTSVKVFELMPPLVDTELSKEIGGQNGIKPIVVAQNLIEALEQDVYEVHVGDTAKIYGLFLSSPAAAFHTLNGIGVPVAH